MQYHNTVTATFLSRLNRFVAKVLLEGREETVHVKNTGRLKELLLPGATVVLAVADNPARKTKYDLVMVYSDQTPVNIDSVAPNAVAAFWARQSNLFSPSATLRREYTYEDSRFDLFVEDGQRKAFIEVKGVTLVQDGVARFPDAPTERGIKHLRGLQRALAAGYEAYVLFVIQRKDARLFTPNDVTHPAFGTALRRAAAAGVKVLAVDCIVTRDGLTVDAPIPVEL